MKAWRAMMKSLACCVYKAINGFGRDIVLFLVRASVVLIFFRSGMTKLNDWENSLFLFEFEYAVPILPYEWTAYLATFFELFMPVLIIVGLCTRLASLPLLAMALVIQFVLGAVNPAYNQIEHYLWMVLLLVLVSHGAGRLSLDWLLCRIYCRAGKEPRSEAPAPVNNPEN